ncbi:MAG: hypothetical protein GY858_04775 [Candidatus Omnitrophica bacterium]|nr:hypothetical protein [Candidatus Omnitrophota bacterium]
MKMPLVPALLLGRVIGFILYLNPKRRRLAFKNIKSAFPEKSNGELYCIIRKSFDNLGLSIIEGLIAPRIFKYVQMRGLENVAQGGVVVGLHEGSWELYNSSIAQNADYAVLAKKQKKKNINTFINELRVQYRVNICFSLKELMKYIRNNYLIGMTMDHGAEDNAHLIEFFSHIIPTPRGAVYLAKKFNKKIFPCFGYRTGILSHVVEIKTPIETAQKSEKELLCILNKSYENDLRKHPAEYLWHYKRFKRKKDLNIIVLSDGKPGHLKQSLSLLELFSQEDYILRAKTIDIQYRNKQSRFIADLVAILTRKNSIAGIKYLKLLLTPESISKLSVSFADIVISTGSLVASVNRIFASSVGAKSVTILRPNIPVKKFDLSIIPEHDRVQSDSITTIKGALCCPENIEKKMKECREFFNLSDSKKISFILGGVLSDKKEFLKNLKSFVPKLKEFSKTHDYKILVSTSRRTPKEADKYLKMELENFENTEAIVYPNHKNYNFVFDGFISISDVAFISSESISMVSETLALNKPCVGIVFEKQEGKHKVFLKLLKNAITLLKPPYRIDEIKPKASSIFEDNRKTVKAAIKTLF